MDTVTGYIDHIGVHKEETGFTVMTVKTDDGPVVCVGVMRGFGEGESVEVAGDFVVHPIYNRQLKIKSIKSLPPENKVAVMRYLGSGAIKGVGEALAKRIVQAFGDDTFRIATDEPERLAEVKGISIKKAYDIGAQLEAKRDVRDIMMYLERLGISTGMSNKIYQKYGHRAKTVIEENPYKLVEDISGIGFKYADDIAAKAGIGMSSEYRTRCGIIHVLLQSALDGNCFYPMDKLVNKSVELLGVDESLVENQIEALIIDGRIKAIKNDDYTAVYLMSYYREEKKVARILSELVESYDDPFENESNDYILAKIREAEDNVRIRLDDTQRRAVLDCMRNGVFLLTGGPGTGKTTIIKVILAMLTMQGTEFYLAAPTGRAAKRMEETTGYEAKTIHRLLEVNGNMEESGENNYFERNEDNPIEADAVIVDEMSMVDIHLFHALISATIPGMKLILVGDCNQLPSVGPGQVLNDLIKSGCIPSMRLEKIYRQDENGHIINYAHMVKNGEIIDFSKKYRDFFLLEKDRPEVITDYAEKLITDNVPREFNIDQMDIQVLTPMKKGVLGTIELNRQLQFRMNPPSRDKREIVFGDTVFRTGDKVMQTKNNYELEWEIIGDYNIPKEKGAGVFNGDVGIVKEINNFTKELTVEFDDGRRVIYSYENLEELELAYAITIHKSQGSEYPVIVIPILSGPEVLMTRNLLYTGITRAKECVILIGSSKAVENMIKNDMIQYRYTSLDKCIAERMGQQ